MTQPRKMHSKPLWYSLFTLMAGLLFLENAQALDRHKIDILTRFDHDFHAQKVFKKQNVSCDHCHNFAVEQKSGRLILQSGAEASNFKQTMKGICHECHTGAETRNKDAPKACYLCHRSSDSLKAIKPANHSNMGWSHAHATNARIDGEGCLNCHMTSQCVQCHQRRNDVSLKNHSRNFRFTHSVIARAQPHHCDTCHSKTYCIQCHMGKK